MMIETVCFSDTLAHSVLAGNDVQSKLYSVLKFFLFRLFLFLTVCTSSSSAENNVKMTLFKNESISFTSRNSTASRIATCWTVRGSNSGAYEIFCTRPDRILCPPRLLYNAHRFAFPGLKRPGRVIPTHSPL
jgi:hypothetical protein